MLRDDASVRPKPEARARSLDTEVSRQERVRIAERPHHDVAGCPFADSGNREQASVHLSAIGTGVKDEPS